MTTTEAADPIAAPPAVTAAELARNHARLRTLAEMSEAFATVATDYRSLIAKIARTTADLVGDGCLVSLAEDERLVSAAHAHRDPAIERAYGAYLAGLPIALRTSAAVAAQVIRSGAPHVAIDIDPAAVVAAADPVLRPLVAQLDVHSYAVVPIRAHDQVIGSLSLFRSGPGRGYVEDDVTLLQDLADRAGLAIDNARLYEELEQRVARRTAELEAVNRELEAFSYSVAHDLRAPLRSIDAFTRALQDDYAPRLDDEGRGYLDHVRGAAARMGRLIDDLLGLAKVSGGELRRVRVDLSAIARTVVARLRQAAPDRVVDVQIAEGLAAEADPRLIEIALTNLVGNAWKFTGKRAGDAVIEVGCDAGSSPTRFWVRDNGAGFDPRHATRLFGVFQRLHPATEFEGTGIGLATVQRIVRRHGGDVGASGRIGAGATFWFTLERP